MNLNIKKIYGYYVIALGLIITHSHGVMERNIIRMQCITKCQNDRDKCLHQAVLADDQYQNQCMLLAQGCLESCYYPQASYITVNPYL